jgi:hypothetical protein
MVWTVGGDVTVSPNSTFELSVNENLIIFYDSMEIRTWMNNTINMSVVGSSLFDNENLILHDNG